MFRFTITDLGEFLGKSPVTIRAWERKGLLTLPRVSGKRTLKARDVVNAARTAHNHGRITLERRALINETVALLEAIELENEPDAP